MANTEMSQQLYQYLCNKIGTEKVVKARREFFKVHDCAVNNKFVERESISSGSKSEGLDLPGSDIDIMLMDKTNVIHNEYPARKPILSSGHLLFLDTNNTPPGFGKIGVHLPPYQIQNDYIYIQGEKIDLRQVENELILPNTSFKHFLKHYFKSYPLSSFSVYNTHGPCTSYIDESVDFAFCFRVDEWPREAFNWISRTRLQDWPPEDLISDIFQEEKSVLLVPIGSKFGAAEDNPLEWRISFSVAEQMLVHNFNHSQIFCYALLKIVLKQVLDKKANKLLCSYFMKTLLFWLIEETGVSMWTPSNLLKCFQSCIARLYYHIKYEYFPNYFIVQNNMFEGKTWGDSKTRLLYILHNIYTEGINFTLRTDTLKDFVLLTTNNHICQDKAMKYNGNDIAIYPLLKYTNVIGLSQIPNLLSKLTRIYDSLTKCKSNLIKSLLSIHFVEGCIIMATDTKYDINRTNKQCYGKYKSLLSYFLLGTNFNLNGWLVLAAFFYQHKQYYITLKIIDFVCYEIKNKKNIIYEALFTHNNRQTYQYTVCKGSSFLQRCKSLCIRAISNVVKDGTVFDKYDFHFDTSSVSSLSYCLFDESCYRLGHYIRFMCFHHLHDIVGRHRALCDFQQVVDNTVITKDTSFYMNASLLHLLQAYMKSNISIPYRNFVKMIDTVQSLLADPVKYNMIKDLRQ